MNEPNLYGGRSFFEGLFFDMFFHRPVGAICSIVFMTVVIFAGMQIVPEWALVRIDVDGRVYYAAVAACGVVS